MNGQYTLERLREDIYKPAAGPQDAIPVSATVAIIGAGPVGLTMANLLGARGVRAVLIEKNSVTADLPKAIIIDDEYMRLLASIGLSQTMAKHVVGPVGINYFSPFGFLLATIPGQVTPNGFPGRSSMAQPMFEKILLEGMRRFRCISACFDAELVDMEQVDDGVRIDIRHGSGVVSQLRADFVVACDGSHSFVRHQLGVEFVGAKLGNLRLVLDLAEFPDADLNCRYMCNPSRPINSIPAPYGGRRIEIMLNGDEDDESAARPDNIKRIIERYTPYSADDIKIARAAVYDFSERVAARLSVGRVFLLGDAAHIMPPSGGQGLNTGGRDAANLAWKLDAVVRGQAEPRILDSFHDERWPHVRAVVDYAVKLGRFANLRSWPRAILRDLGFAIGRFVPAVRRHLMENDAPKPYYRHGLFVHEGAAVEHMVGRIVPRLAFRDDSGAARNIDELASQDFALVGFGVGPAALKQAADHLFWRVLDPKLVSVVVQTDASRHVSAEQGAFTIQDAAQAAWARELGGCVVLVRPDRYIAAVVRLARLDDLATRCEALLGSTAALAGFPRVQPAAVAAGA